jgi:hypothetical protein
MSELSSPPITLAVLGQSRYSSSLFHTGSQSYNFAAPMIFVPLLILSLKYNYITKFIRVYMCAHYYLNYFLVKLLSRRLLLLFFNGLLWHKSSS